MNQDLDERVNRVIRRLGFVPSREYARQVPYWQELVAQVEGSGESWTEYLRRRRANELVQTLEVDIPSFQQKRIGIEIATRKRKAILNAPGSQKTLAALCALVPIREMNPEEKIKTFISCPSYIATNWLQEIERAIPRANSVIITKENREAALAQASLSETDFVIIGTDMLYRRANSDYNRNELFQESKKRKRSELRMQLPTPMAALERLGQMIGPKIYARWKEAVQRGEYNWLDIIDRIAEEETKVEIDPVSAVLEKKVLEGKRYYAILDEYHNIVHPNRIIAGSLARILRGAEWCTLLSGTGIGNKPEDLAYAAYVLGFVDDPIDFKIAVKKDPRLVRAFLDVYATHPIYRLKDVDPLVPESEFILHPHNLSLEEMAIQSALLDSDLFDGKEKYGLLNSLYINARRLLPENGAGAEDVSDQKALTEKMETFFAQNPKLRGIVETITSSRFKEIKRIIENEVSPGAKVAIYTELTTLVVEELSHFLGEEKVVMVTQNDSSTPTEILLTPVEMEALQQREKELKLNWNLEICYRSQLTREMREAINVPWYEVFGLSEREIKVHTFATHPDKPILATSYGVLREGINLREIDEIVEAMPTTVPSRREQAIARRDRSGQRKKGTIHSPFVPDSFEEGKMKFRDGKKELNEQLLHGQELGPKFIERYLTSSGQPDSSVYVQKYLQENSRAIIAQMLSRLQGAGTLGFIEAMSAHNNALVFAHHYSQAWEMSKSANNGRLCLQILDRVRKNSQPTKKRFNVLDLACGPLVTNQLLEERLHHQTKPQIEVTSVDINRYQIEMGLRSTHPKMVGQYYLGSVTDLSRLVRLEDTKEKVFDPRKHYPQVHALERSSYDFILCSFLVYLLDREDSYKLLTEAHRLLTGEQDGGHLLISMPREKIADESIDKYLADIASVGFEINEKVTGTYRSDRFTITKAGVKPSGFEVYVILAQKGSPPTLGEEEIPAFKLTPGYTISQRAGPGCTAYDQEGSKSQAGIICETFYKKENGKKLDDIMGHGAIFGDEFFGTLAHVMQGDLVLLDDETKKGGK